MKSLISLFAILALAFAIPSKRDVSLDKLLSIEKELAGMLKTSAQSEEKIETHVKAQSSFNGPATDLSLFDPRREPPNVVISGRFVAFQSLQTPKDRVGCDRSGCAATQCGQELLNEAEWFDCYSEVYKIYRRDGDGVVRVGDHVGFLQYKSYQWLQCPSDSCRLGNCPGQPNEADGFEESSKWCECDDYSFRLAAYNKTIGQPIYQNDIIMAYHPKSREFMTISGHKTSCPRTFPPSLGEYEGCIEGTYILNY